MRGELIEYLKGLSDPDYQRECWVKKNFPPGIEYDCFDNAVHFLFDDTRLASDPSSMIGMILEDEHEVRLVYNVCQKIDDVFDRHGLDLTDEQYINCAEWAAVVNAAEQAFAAMRADSA